MSFETDLQKVRNEGRKAIIKLYDSKIKEQVTMDLRGLDNAD